MEYTLSLTAALPSPLATCRTMHIRPSFLPKLGFDVAAIDTHPLLFPASTLHWPFRCHHDPHHTAFSIHSWSDVVAMPSGTLTESAGEALLRHPQYYM